MKLSHYSVDVIVGYMKNCGIIKHVYEQNTLEVYLSGLEFNKMGEESLSVVQKFDNERQKPGYGED